MIFELFFLLPLHPAPPLPLVDVPTLRLLPRAHRLPATTRPPAACPFAVHPALLPHSLPHSLTHLL